MDSITATFFLDVISDEWLRDRRLIEYSISLQGYVYLRGVEKGSFEAFCKVANLDITQDGNLKELGPVLFNHLVIDHLLMDMVSFL